MPPDRAEEIDFTAKDKELAKEDELAEVLAETPKRTLADVAANLASPNSARKTGRDRMEDLLDEATAVLPSSPEELKNVIKEVMRVTFERCSVATRLEQNCATGGWCCLVEIGPAPDACTMRLSAGRSELVGLDEAVHGQEFSNDG